MPDWRSKRAPGLSRARTSGGSNSRAADMTVPGYAAVPPHRFIALDSLRGIAALGVVLHHIPASNGPGSLALFRNGGLFVDFFFVLSGFVIAASYGERLASGFSLRRFALLRIGRVWPLHAVVCCVGLGLELAAWQFGNQGLSSLAPFGGAHSLGHFFTAFFLLDGWIPGWTNFYSRAGWSISVELPLYAAAALAFRYGRGAMAALCLLGALAVAAELAWLDWPVATNAMQRGFAGFVLGMGCWFAHRRLPGWTAGTATLLEFIALTALFAVIALAPGAVPSLSVLLPAALVLLIFARDQGAIGTLLGTAPFVWLGRISYSIYMVHALIVSRLLEALLLLSRRLGLSIIGFVVRDGIAYKQLALAPLPSTLIQLAIVALVLLGAHFAWRLVEEPARQTSRRLAARL